MDSIKPLTEKRRELSNTPSLYQLFPLPASIYRRFRRLAEDARLAAQKINDFTADDDELADRLCEDAEWLTVSLQRPDPVEWWR